MSNDYEDILSDSLELLGGKPVIANEEIHYGPLVLVVAPKLGKAITLLASSLFSPSIFFAERIERGLLNCDGQTVLELGAGAALPSLLLSTVPNPPELLVITDYPDKGIFGNLVRNVTRNAHLVSPNCCVVPQMHDWGTDPAPLLALLPPSIDKPGYDILILSDLLHFGDCHDVLVKSIESLLKQSPKSRVHISAGVYTKPDVCDGFLEKSRAVGLVVDEVFTDPAEAWMGTHVVRDLSPADLAIRKARCRYWIGQWRT